MKFRIHGDNIIECERALNLLALSFEAEAILKPNSILIPLFSICNKEHELFEVELFGGHDRWNVNFNTELITILR